MATIPALKLYRQVECARRLLELHHALRIEHSPRSDLPTENAACGGVANQAWDALERGGPAIACCE
jgi:hypothetical protein